MQEQLSGSQRDAADIDRGTAQPAENKIRAPIRRVALQYQRSASGDEAATQDGNFLVRLPGHRRGDIALRLRLGHQHVTAAAAEGPVEVERGGNGKRDEEQARTGELRAPAHLTNPRKGTAQ